MGRVIREVIISNPNQDMYDSLLTKSRVGKTTKVSLRKRLRFLPVDGADSLGLGFSFCRV